jgi:aspartate aminotransferase-like enzyme
VHPDVAAAQLRPMIGHRGKAIEELIARLEPGLKYVFRTARPVYISTSSATGLMEAAVRNGARRKVLSLVNGAFSERFYKIALACGLEAVELRVPAGQHHTPEMLADALAGADYDAVTVVHSESATGVLNPIEQLARVTKAAGDVAILVDSVTGIAAMCVETDAWGLDVVLTGSQKALALPPGLALGVASERVLKRAAAKRDRGIYFDFVEYEKYITKNQTPNTPAVSLMAALDVQLQRIRAETIEARWQRHAEMRDRTCQWVENMQADGIKISLFAPEGYRSPTVTCIRVAQHRPGSEIVAALKVRGYTIGAGYGDLKDETIRIGHMGDHTLDGLEAMLSELAAVLRQ